MDKLSNFKIPTKRRIVEVEPEPEDDHEKQSSSVSVPDLPASEGWDIIDATDEEKQNIQELLKESTKKSTGHTPRAEECWKQMTVQKIQMIRNKRLKQSYDTYKKKQKIPNDVMGFRVVYDTEEIERIAENGLCVDNDILIEIGDPLRGVVVFNSPATAYAGRYLYANIPIQVMMFRTAVSGKKNEVTWGGSWLPSKSHTSHVLMKIDANKNKFHRYLLEHYESAVYHYEYMPNKTDIRKYPSMILPYAIITYTLPDTAFPTQTPPKLSKINKALMYFGDEEFCKHTLVFNTNEIPTTVCLPSFLRDVPYILHESRATPVACCMDDLSAFPELNILRGPDCFGKMLSTDSVILPDRALATYYILRFGTEQQDFVDLFRKNKYMMVWTHFPFTVFYIPSGDISAEFGFPHKGNNYMHLIVHRADPGDSTTRSLSMFAYSPHPLDYALYWNKPSEYRTEALEEADFEDAVFEDDYGEEEMEQREAEEEERERQERLELNEEGARNDPKVEFAQAAAPTGLKGILCLVGSRSRRLPLRWRDQAYPEHTPGLLSETRYFDNDEASPHPAEDHTLSFNEKQKKERVDERDKRDDDLFKNAMAEGTRNSLSPLYDPASVPYSPDNQAHEQSQSPFASPSNNNVSPSTSESPGNTCTPASVCAPSPDQPDFRKCIPQSFNRPPPPVPPNFAPPFIDVSVPPPPPPGRRIAPSRVAPPPGKFSVPPPPINFSAPPPGIAPFLSSPMPVPPPVTAQHRLTPPPPGTSGAPVTPLPAPGLFIPVKLSTPNFRPSCLVPGSGPPRDPRIAATPSSSASSAAGSAPPTPAPFEEEKGESPMDVDEDDSVMEVDKQEEDNDILKQCFTSGVSLVPSVSPEVPASVPAGVSVSADHVLLPHPDIQKTLDAIRGNHKIMGMIKRKKLESDSASSSSETDLLSRNSINEGPPSESTSQDTDLRKHVNFTINKPKSTSIAKLKNALGNDSDEEEDDIPLPPGKAPSSSAQDTDYRQTPPVTSRTNSFTQDRDDRPRNVAARSHSTSAISGGSGPKLVDVQQRLLALNRTIGNGGHTVNGNQPAHNLFAHLPHPRATEVPPIQSGSVAAFFPNLLSASNSLLGLRGVLSMRTESDSEVSGQPGVEQPIRPVSQIPRLVSADDPTSSANNGQSSSSSYPGHTSTVSLTENLKEMSIPSQMKDPKIENNSNNVAVNDAISLDSDDDIMIIDPDPSQPSSSRPNRNVLRPTDGPPGITKNAGNFIDALTKFRRIENITNLCIFVDPTLNPGRSDISNSNELQRLFTKLFQQNQIERTKIESKVFVHHSVESTLIHQTSLVGHYHSINSFKKGQSPLIKSLPMHTCDTKTSVEATKELAKCMVDIKTKTGGTQVIYLTFYNTSGSSGYRLFTEKDIKVMNMRELSQFVDDILRS